MSSVISEHLLADETIEAEEGAGSPDLAVCQRCLDTCVAVTLVEDAGGYLIETEEACPCAVTR